MIYAHQCIVISADFAVTDDQAEALDPARHRASPPDGSGTPLGDIVPVEEVTTPTTSRPNRSRFGRYLAFVRERRRQDEHPQEGQNEQASVGGNRDGTGSVGRRNRRGRGGEQMGPGPF